MLIGLSHKVVLLIYFMQQKVLRQKAALNRKMKSLRKRKMKRTKSKLHAEIFPAD